MTARSPRAYSPEEDGRQRENGPKRAAHPVVEAMFRSAAGAAGSAGCVQVASE